MAYIGTNVTVEIEKTLASGVAITSITKASPGVATKAAHGLTNGDIGVFVVTGGMVELDGQAVRVASTTSGTFALESLDTTDYSTFTSGTGTFYEVTAWETLGNAQSISMPNPAPATIISASARHLTPAERLEAYTLALAQLGPDEIARVEAAAETDAAFKAFVAMVAKQEVRW